MKTLDATDLASVTGGTKKLPPGRPGIPQRQLPSPLPLPGLQTRPLPSPQPMQNPNPFPIATHK